MKYRLSLPHAASHSSRAVLLLLSAQALALAPLGCGNPSNVEQNVGGSGGDAGSGSRAGTGGTAGSAGQAGSAGSAGTGGTGGSQNPSTGALQVDLYQSLHTTETCAGAGPTRDECLSSCGTQYNDCYNAATTTPEYDACSLQLTNCENACPVDNSQPECVYANIYFLATCNGANVNDLAPANVSVVIGSRDVGVEGSVALTQQNGLQVDLLLDRSYSIKAAGAEGTVRQAANAFIAALPDDAQVKVSAFASETTVPEVLGSQGSDYYYSVGSESSALTSIINSAYAPYQIESSQAFTKLFDAAVGLAEAATTNDAATAALPSVAVLFTDGTDTASTGYDTAAEARTAMTSAKPSMKVYAIGLGNDVDEQALATLSEDRSYSATEQTALSAAFEEVAGQLGAIYRYRVLVPEANYAAQGVLTVENCGETSVTNFVMDSNGSSDPITGDNSCRYAFDNECDEPTYCDYGTDRADCGY